MVVVAYRMFRPPTGEKKALSNAAMIASGIGVGLLGGLLGAGGGFLIVPLLTLGIGLEMPRAVPTSLAIISTQSLAAVASDLNRPYPWSMLGGVVVASLLGMVIGQVLRPKVKAANLKTGFAYLVVIVAIFTFYKVGVNHFGAPNVSSSITMNKTITVKELKARLNSARQSSSSTYVPPESTQRGTFRKR